MTSEYKFFNFRAISTISTIALLFGFWFCKNQINAIAPNAWEYYPKILLPITVFKCYLTILIFYALFRGILSTVSANKLSDTFIAATFIPLIGVYISISMISIVLSIMLIQFMAIVSVLNKDDYYRISSKYSADVLILGFYSFLNLFLTTRFSPVHWSNSLIVNAGHNVEEIPFLVPGFKGFLSTKLFSFANVDYSQWAGIMNPPITFSSTFIQLMTFIFDLPSVSIEVFHIAILATYFVISIAGSFGFYLFLRYAAKLNYLISVFGGVLFYFSASPFINDSFLSDGGALLSSFIVLPYAMLFMSLAFEYKNKLFVAFASVALAAQFFIYSPHPEGTIYSLFFLMVYSSGLMLFTPTISWKNKFSFALMGISLFFCLAGYVIFPILIDRFSGDMFVFAHIGDIVPIPLDDYYLYLKLLSLFGPISLYLLYKQQRLTPVFKSCFLLMASLLVLLLIASDEKALYFLVQKLHVGIHFWVTSRLGTYFSMSVYIIAMYAMHAIIEWLKSIVYVSSLTNIGSETIRTPGHIEPQHGN
jgi:hypothetical protein